MQYYNKRSLKEIIKLPKIIRLMEKVAEMESDKIKIYFKFEK